MAGGFLYPDSQVVLCAPMIFVCLSITIKSSLLFCSYSSYLLTRSLSRQRLMVLLRYIIEEREPLREKKHLTMFNFFN